MAVDTRQIGTRTGGQTFVDINAISDAAGIPETACSTGVPDPVILKRRN